MEKSIPVDDYIVSVTRYYRYGWGEPYQLPIETAVRYQLPSCENKVHQWFLLSHNLYLSAILFLLQVQLLRRSFRKIVNFPLLFLCTPSDANRCASRTYSNGFFFQETEKSSIMNYGFFRSSFEIYFTQIKILYNYF